MQGLDLDLTKYCDKPQSIARQANDYSESSALLTFDQLPND